MIAQVQAARQVEPSTEWAGFIHASIYEVFDMMLGLKAEPADGAGFRYEATSMVGLAGLLCGLFTVRCSSEVAGKLACKMLGVEKVESENEIRDALGEICNMIAGGFKSKVPGLSEGCMLSVPTTVTGSNYEIHPMRATPAFLDLFSRAGDCRLEVLLHVIR